MKKNVIIEVTIEDMSSEGLGIGHAMGMAVFVKDTVPGDRVLAEIRKLKKNLIARKRINPAVATALQ